MVLSSQRLAGHHIFVVASGAGTTIQDRLWMVPGTSGFLVGAAFPYSQDDTDDFLGFTPEKYCSKEEALQLAMEAYVRAARHAVASGKPGKPVGVAVTAAVASLTGDVRRGDSRIHVAIVSAAGTYHIKVVCDKGVGEKFRRVDNHTAEVAALDLIGIVTGSLNFDGIKHFYYEDTFEEVPEADLRAIFFKHPFFEGRRRQLGAAIHTLFPGSFNPIHDGHREIATEAIHRDPQGEFAYMICLDSVHKPPLPVTEALKRAAQFRVEDKNGNTSAVLFTAGDPLFVDKFRAHPFSTFVIGVDTLTRMLDPKWGPSPDGIFQAMAEHGVTMMVCDRIIDDVHVSAAGERDRLVPPRNRHRFKLMTVQPSAVSSSAIRAAAGT